MCPKISMIALICQGLTYLVFEQELGLYKAQTKLPFNAFGTMAMARDVRTLIHTMAISTYVYGFDG